MSRSLSNARLIAGWLKKERLAARLTCRSSSSGWSARNRFRSIFLKCASRILTIRAIHWLNVGQTRIVIPQKPKTKGSQ